MTGGIMGEQRAYRRRFHGPFEVGFLALQRRGAIVFSLIGMLTASATPMQFDFGVEGVIEA